MDLLSVNRLFECQALLRHAETFAIFLTLVQHLSIRQQVLIEYTSRFLTVFLLEGLAARRIEII